MKSALIQSLIALAPVLAWPVLSALLTLLLRKRTAEEWEAWALKKPALAFLVEACRSAGLDLVGLTKAFERYAKRKAGEVPLNAVNASKLPEPVKEEIRKALEQKAD